jgi:uncharacterized membrane protein YeaQ/YmgE (transglycosylase-associated protein family)
MITAIIGWVVFGLVVGLIARALMPGPQAMGFILTALLGIAGSFVGGWLGTMLFGAGEPDASQAAGWIGSIIGALILLVLYGMVAGRRTV